MGTNIVFAGWDRPVPGRERTAMAHFQEFMQYLGGLQQAGTIQSFEGGLLNLHGGDLNGFMIVRGDSAKLDALLASEAWESHMMRAGVELQGFGQTRGVSGDLLMKQMEAYGRVIPA